MFHLKHVLLRAHDSYVVITTDKVAIYDMNLSWRELSLSILTLTSHETIHKYVVLHTFERIHHRSYNIRKVLIQTAELGASCMPCSENSGCYHRLLQTISLSFSFAIVRSSKTLGGRGAFEAVLYAHNHFTGCCRQE